MIMKVYSIYDSKVEAYMQPFFMQTKGQAIRALTDSLMDEKSQYAKHPQDFTLFELSDYDDSEGKFIPHPSPKSVGVLIEFMPSAD